MDLDKPKQRRLGDRIQICVGACVVCGQNVWVYVGEAAPKPLAHGRPCSDRLSA